MFPAKAAISQASGRRPEMRTVGVLPELRHPHDDI
jgi:hypothetical protein